MNWPSFWSESGARSGAEILLIAILFAVGAVAGRITIAIVKKRWLGKK